MNFVLGFHYQDIVDTDKYSETWKNPKSETVLISFILDKILCSSVCLRMTRNYDSKLVWCISVILTFWVQGSPILSKSSLTYLIYNSGIPPVLLF